MYDFMQQHFDDTRSKEDLDVIKQQLDDADLPIFFLKQINQQQQQDHAMIQARVKKWTNLERKLVKRIQKVQKQTQNVKKMVASKQ